MPPRPPPQKPDRPNATSRNANLQLRQERRQALRPTARGASEPASPPAAPSQASPVKPAPVSAPALPAAAPSDLQRQLEAARQEVGLLRAERDRYAAHLVENGGIGVLVAKVEALKTALGEKLDGLEVYLRANQERNERRDASLATSDKAAEERAKAVVAPLDELLTRLNAKFNGILERLGENSTEVTEQCQALLAEIRALGDRIAVLETGPRSRKN